jgi:hypothetical protein
MNTVRLKPQLQEKVRRLADKKGVTVSEIHRMALEAFCASELADPTQSRYDDVMGVWEGPPELAADCGRLYVEAMAEKHGRHSR